MSITDDDRQTIRDLFYKIQSEIKGDWLEKIPDPEQRQAALNIVALENLHRVMLETTFNECLPYDDVFIGELTTRMAAIAITALPFHLQDQWTEQICKTIPISVKRKMGSGHSMRTKWNMGS